MNIIEAIKDEKLFRPFLADKEDSLETWIGWMTCLRALYGLPIAHKRKKFIKQVTGRIPSELPENGFDTALFLTGRRSGKSRIASVIGAFEAVLTHNEQKLAPGERGIIPIISVSKNQARIVRDYLRAIFNVPLLETQLAKETAEGFELKSGTRIEILAGDFRTIRGYTLLAAIVDEAAFFGYDVESKIRSDSELIRAIKPALATTGGKLIVISSPYARKGWCYTTYKKHFGNDSGKILVVNCPSRTLNSTLPQSVVDDAIAEDLQAAKSEYLGEFRDDVAAFIPREVVEALVIKGRKELSPNSKIRYFAFADLSGGRSDDSALAIAHAEKRKVVLDILRVYKPPMSPNYAIAKMAEELKRLGIRRVTGDNYAADFVKNSFEANGIQYQRSDKPKAKLYLELLPRLCSGEIELLDNETLVNQIAGLERRTRSGGRDIVDHGPNQHDDLANVVAGVADVTCAKRFVIGGLG